jgi:hypothetical protein
MYVVYAGGIGDILLAYLEPDSVMGYFKACKWRWPTSSVCLRTFTNGRQQVHEFLKRNPYIDILECSDFTTDWGSERINGRKGEIYKDHVWWDSVGNGLGPECYEQPNIYLSQDDMDRFLREVLPEPYITVHAESKSHHRTWEGRVDYRRVIDVARECGKKVVLLGGTRQTDAGPNLINLTGASIGLNAKAVKQAAGHIGAISAFNAVATAYRKPTLVFGDRETHHYILTDPCGIYGQMREKGNTRFEIWPANYPSIVEQWCRNV